MGLFAAKHEHSRSWLAAFLCCWTAADIDEHPLETERPHRGFALLSEAGHESLTRPKAPSPPVAVWNTQPVPLQPLPPRRPMSFPITRTYSKGDEFIRSEDRVRPIAERPPSLKLLEFGDGALLGRSRLSWQARQKESAIQSKHPTSTNSTDIRQLEHAESKRHSLVPLKFNPVVLNREPYRNALPFIDSYTASTEDLTTAENRTSYRESRESPYQRVSRLSFTTVANPLQVVASDRAQTMAPIQENQSRRPPLSTHSSSSSLRSTRHDVHSFSTQSRPVSEVTQSPASSVQSSRRNMDLSAASTPNRTFTWNRRKRSASLFRKSSSESVDWELDKEILELNTIVEERRAESSRPQTSHDKHVPAVAPSMAGRARSETLNDIGSVFSRPVLAGSLPVAMTNRLSRPFTSVPEPYAALTTSPTSPAHRLSGWLSDLPQSPTSDVRHEKPEDHMPLSRGRHVSQSSLMTSTDDEDVPSLTAASTPTSLAKGHNRSSTVDSKFAPGLPPATIYEDAKLEQEMRFPWLQSQPVIVDDKNGVGMAL